MLWAEVMYKLSIGEGVQPIDKLGDVPIISAQTGGAATYSYSLKDFFDTVSVPSGSDTLKFLLTQDTACRSLDIRRRALGSLLHMVQDSYARGHVRRVLINPGDLLPGETAKFKPGKYGKYGDVENFHSYRDQDPKEHDKYDEPGSRAPTVSSLDSFNEIVGARDAIDAGITLLDLWRAGTAWGAMGGAKDFLENTVFQLAATVTPADGTV